MRVLKIPTIIDQVKMETIFPVSQIVCADHWMLADHTEDPNSIRIHRIGTDTVIRASTTLDWLAEKEQFIKLSVWKIVNAWHERMSTAHSQPQKDVVFNVANIIQLRPYVMGSKFDPDHYILFVPSGGGFGKTKDFHLNEEQAFALRSRMSVL